MLNNEDAFRELKNQFNSYSSKKYIDKIRNINYHFEKRKLKDFEFNTTDSFIENWKDFGTELIYLCKYYADNE